MKSPEAPETMLYSVKAENNSLVQVEARFDRNPVGTMDDTMLTLYVAPVVSFPFPVEEFQLAFSDSAMNKVLAVCNRL